MIETPAIARLIGESGCMRRLKEQIANVAITDARVLITGETGTGKELCAQAIHELSPRSDGSFVALNCGGVPSELVESELFGHKRGAFSQAYESRRGLVTDAAQGTLFLDEVDSLPHAVQPKLLRFLQENEYRVVGENKVRNADVRLVSATAADLPERIDRGAFRSDLYYRVAVIRISIPPLRERGDDILRVAHHFFRDFANRYHKEHLRMGSSVEKQLVKHHWPGNVRELEHAIHRGVVMTQGSEMTPSDLGLAGADQAQELEESLEGTYHELKRKLVERFEYHYVQGLLKTHCGNVSRAARFAGLDRRTFQRLIAKHRVSHQN